jgi:hypothetical protein
MADMKFEIPHNLGKAEARRRIEAGMPTLAAHIPGGGTVDPEWRGEDRLLLAIKAMGQKIGAELEIGEAVVSGTVKIPMMLSMMSGPIGEFVKTSAEKMLSHARRRVRDGAGAHIHRQEP